MSYRFMDGKPVTHGPVPVPGVEDAAAGELVPVIIVPQILVVCAACGCAMPHDRFTSEATVLRFACYTMKCKNRGLYVDIPLERFQARSTGHKEGLCQCERCIPDPEH